MTSSDTAPRVPVVIGRGRVGTSLAAALERRGMPVELRAREDGLSGLDGRLVLLCVPDSEIGAVAGSLAHADSTPGAVGHTSGATGLDVLAVSGAGRLFSVHPLQTIPDGDADLEGCPAAIAGSDAEGLAFARELAETAGMVPFEVPEQDRAAYHAAASIASNFLVTLEQSAAELMDAIGVPGPRDVLAPLVRRSLENWLERGPAALTGPIARGDEATVEAHRRAIAEIRPDLAELYETLAKRTRLMAGTGGPR